MEPTICADRGEDHGETDKGQERGMTHGVRMTSRTIRIDHGGKEEIAERDSMGFEKFSFILYQNKTLF